MLIPRNIAAAAAKITDRENNRYAIGAVRIERQPESAGGRPLAVSTDGRRMLAVEWQEPDREDAPAAGVDLTPRPGCAALIPAATLADLAKSKIGAKSPREAARAIQLQEPEPGANAAPLAVTDGEQSTAAPGRFPDGLFPRWRDAIPAPGRGEKTIFLDSQLLRELLEAVEQCCGTPESRQVAVSFTSNTEPVVITAQNCDIRAVAIIMPMNPGNSPERPWHRLQDYPISRIPAAVAPAAAAEPEPEPVAEPEPAEPVACGDY